MNEELTKVVSVLLRSLFFRAIRNKRCFDDRHGVAYDSPSPKHDQWDGWMRHARKTLSEPPVSGMHLLLHLVPATPGQPLQHGSKPSSAKC